RRLPKNALAASNTSGGGGLVRWKYLMAPPPSGGPRGLEAPQREAVQDDGQARPRHGGARQHGGQEPAGERIQRPGRDGDEHDVVTERPHQVPADRPEDALRQADRSQDAPQVSADEGDVGGF